MTKPNPEIRKGGMPDFDPNMMANGKAKKYSRGRIEKNMGGPQGKQRGNIVTGNKLDMKIILRLLKYFLNYKLTCVIVLISLAVSAIAGAKGSLFIKTLIDDYITPLVYEDNPVFDGLLRAIGGMACIYAAGIVANLISEVLMAIISQKIMKAIRDEMFEKMEKLPISYFDRNSYGSVMSHYTNDIDSLEEMIGRSIKMIISSAITVVSVFVAMVTTSIFMTLFVCVIVFFIMLISRKLGGKSGRYFKGQLDATGELNGFIEEFINGQKVVKVFNHEEAAKSEFDELNEELRSNAYNANKIANMIMPITGNLNNLQYILVAMVGGTLAINGLGGMTLGSVAAFLQLSKSFAMPVNQVSQQINMIVMAMAASKRIFDMIDEKPETDEGYVTLVNVKREGEELVETSERTGMWGWKHPHGNGELTYRALEGNVEFDDVDFGYTEEKLVLHNITLNAAPGQKVAFVGATGAGKTTITNLINRFYDLADGKIRYDGINVNKIRKGDLRRSLGMVLQDTNLFTGTVRENIRYGRLDATDDEVVDAAKLVNAHEFIMMLPNGYDTMIENNGANLSQGQRQLLSIARAAVADPPVMILDEATSSIDTRTEALVQHGMDQLMKGRTVFVIAHRLSTVRNSDIIMVLDRGRIIEQGNHDELIEKRGTYYQLYTGAFELD